MLSSTIGPDFNAPQPLRILHQNFKPCDLLIDEPEPNPLPEKLAKKAEAKAKLEKIDSARREYAAFVLAQYGPTGKPAGSYQPPDGDWTSSTPNEFLTWDCAPGFDPTRLDAAEAAADVWRGVRPWKNCISSCGQYIWIQNEGTFAQWVPLADRPALADSEGVQRPQTVAWTPSPADVKWTVAATRRKALSPRTLSPKELNDTFESYVTPLTGVDTQTGNLQIALYLFAEARWYQCASFMKDREADLQPDDIISGFTADLIHRLGQGQYAKHEGKFDRWLFKKWAHYFAGVKTQLNSEANMTQRVEDDPEEDEDRVPGTLYIEDLARQINERLIEPQIWNQPVQRVKRILCDLDNPATRLGQIDDDMKQMLRSMAGGKKLKEAAKEAGMSEGHGRRKLRALAPICQQPFVSGPTEAEAETERWQQHLKLIGGAL